MSCSIREFTDETAGNDSAENTNSIISTGTDPPFHPAGQTLGRRKVPASIYEYILSDILKDLNLRDWEIRAAELEILKHSDGSRILLGAGGFGQVRYVTFCCH